MFSEAIVTTSLLTPPALVPPELLLFPDADIAVRYVCISMDNLSDLKK